MHRLIFAVCTLLFTGLLTGLQPAHAIDESSPFSKIPVGSTLTLHTPLTIGVEQASVHMQNGQVLSFNQIDKFYANCDLEVRTLAKTPTPIRPDTFIIRRVVQEADVAMNGWQVVASSSGDAGPSHVDYSTIMFLESVNQPDVLRLTCEHWEDPVEAEFLSISQIRQALGKLITLQLN